jgi:hypothetical protein
MSRSYEPRPAQRHIPQLTADLPSKPVRHHVSYYSITASLVLEAAGASGVGAQQRTRHIGDLKLEPPWADQQPLRSAPASATGTQ